MLNLPVSQNYSTEKVSILPQVTHWGMKELALNPGHLAQSPPSIS